LPSSPLALFHTCPLPHLPSSTLALL
jgi:hypothetical protein